MEKNNADLRQRRKFALVLMLTPQEFVNMPDQARQPPGLAHQLQLREHRHQEPWGHLREQLRHHLQELPRQVPWGGRFSRELQGRPLVQGRLSAAGPLLQQS